MGVLAAGLAFVAGMMVQQHRSGNKGSQVLAESNTRFRPNPDRQVSRSPYLMDGDRLRSAEGDAIPATVQPVIRVAPQIDRLRRFLPMLEGLTPDNWEKLLATMSDETSEFGRFQQQEWDLALRQIGRMDGARAAEIYAAKGNDDSLRKILAGWAQTDPEAAWKWVASYKDERGRRDVWRGALIGLAELNPDEAMRRLDSLPFEVKGGTISFLVSPMIQAEGIDATAERIKKIYAEYKAKPADSITPKEEEFVYAFFHNVCDIKRNAGYSPEKRMEALELLASFPDLARQSPWLIPRTVAATAKDDPARTMQVVEQMSMDDRGFVATEGVDVAAKAWVEKDPEGFKEWLKANLGKPIAQVAARHLPGGMDADQE